jgi:hypothetical protein
MWNHNHSCCKTSVYYPCAAVPISRLADTQLLNQHLGVSKFVFTETSDPSCNVFISRASPEWNPSSVVAGTSPEQHLVWYSWLGNPDDRLAIRLTRRRAVFALVANPIPNQWMN